MVTTINVHNNSSQYVYFSIIKLSSIVMILKPVHQRTAGDMKTLFCARSEASLRILALFCGVLAVHFLDLVGAFPYTFDGGFCIKLHLTSATPRCSESV